ncbi:hypothetical protein Hanom_Chr11g01025061 [Helianthus anomalus]
MPATGAPRPPVHHPTTPAATGLWVVIPGCHPTTPAATGLWVLAGAALLKSVMDQNPMMSPGSGSGCRTCAGFGWMMCNSCGGSGTGRPLPVRTSARPNQPY